MKLTKLARLELEATTAFLSATNRHIAYKQRKWHIDNNIMQLVTCIGNNCNNPVKWCAKSKKYRTYCSSKCVHTDPTIIEKTKQTCLKRFGTTSNLNNPECQERIKQTNIKNLGVANPFSSKVIQEQIKKTNLDKFGVEYPAQSKVIMDQMDKTNFERYGRRRSSQLIHDEETYLARNDKDALYDMYYNQKMSVVEIAEKLQVGNSQLCKHLKNDFGFEFRKIINQSAQEKALALYIQELGINVETSNRKILSGKELDIYMPEYNIAIEFNGLRFHTEISGQKGRTYHSHKTSECLKQGIQLIHIMDYEYADTELVHSRLLCKFGLATSIGARKTNIVTITPTVSKQFMDKNHIQKNAGASYHIGLNHNGEIVAVMTFGKSRFAKDQQWELIRYASKLNTAVVGGASKLFKRFITDRNPKSIVSYSDNRWNTGNLYTCLGFSKISNGSANYWYTKDYRTVESRMKYQKHKLEKRLDIFDNDLTEWENMQVNKYDRYWDCGSSKFILTI